jgi:hypothetical protein
MSNASSIAAALGRLAKGVPKKLSAAERERRRRSLAEVREKRWPKKPTSKPS